MRIYLKKITFQEFKKDVFKKLKKMFPKNEQRDLDNFKMTYESGSEDTYVIKLEDGTIIGFFMLEKLPDCPYYLDYFTIYKKYQNKGYGSAVMKAILEKICANEGLCAEIEKVDPMLPKNAFMAAIAWAGEDYSAILEKVPDNSKLWEWQISPLRGDVSVMKNVRIFVGTHEIFYPDILLFDKKLRDSGVDVFTYVAPEMVHEFPLFPLKEVKWSVDEIIRILSEP